MCPLRLPNICCFSVRFLNTQTLSISECYDFNAKLLSYILFLLFYDDAGKKIYDSKERGTIWTTTKCVLRNNCYLRNYLKK